MAANSTGVSRLPWRLCVMYSHVVVLTGHNGHGQAMRFCRGAVSGLWHRLRLLQLELELQQSLPVLLLFMTMMTMWLLLLMWRGRQLRRSLNG